MFTLRLQAAGLPVEVRSELPEVVAALRAMWAPALVEISSPRLVYEVDARGIVTREGHVIARPQDRGRLVPRIEGDLLKMLGTASRELLVLHAGAVVLGDRLILFVGEANSGKSTMTRAALRRGASYLTDDSLFCQRDSVSGLARSVHFDPFRWAEGELSPPYLVDCDLDSYRFQASDGTTWVTPIWHGNFETLHHYAPIIHRTVVVALERGEHAGIREIADLERASLLVGASLASAQPDWSLLPRGPSFRLVWNREPERMLDELLERIERGAS